MTDNDIIKALECCGDENFCKSCPFRKVGCQYIFSKEALALINRQKSEIACLKNKQQVTEQVRAEAIKEFAENLKSALLGWDSDAKDEDIEWAIDNLVKEMVGERE